jgi:hypothetical protein
LDQLRLLDLSCLLGQLCLLALSILEDQLRQLDQLRL